MKEHILLTVLFALLGFAPMQAAELLSDTEIDAEFRDIELTVSGTQVHVGRAAGLTLEIYNVAGVRVGTYKIDSDDKTIDLNLQHGCYILKVGQVVRKISIR